MGRILSLPFGLNSLTAGIEIDAITNGTPLSLTSAPIYLKYLSSGDDTSSYVTRSIIAAAAGRTYYARFRFKYHTLPTNTDGSVGIFYLCTTDGNYRGLNISLTTSGKLQLRNGFDNAQQGSDSGTLTADTDYIVEASYTYTGGAIVARLNGVQFASGTSDTGESANGVYIGLLPNGSAHTTAGEWYFKDIAVNDDQGSYQNTWPGNGNIIMLRPSATGDSAQWTRAGTDTGANWSQCNDIPPSDASYIQATAAALDMYNCVDSGISAGATVNVVEVGGRFKRSASVSPGFKFRIIKAASGTEALSAEITPQDSTNWRTNSIADPKTSPIILYKDPDGSLSWTQTTIDSMQIGVVYATDTNRLVQISEVWAIVDYTAPSYIKFGGAPAVTSGLAGVPKLRRILTAATIAATSVLSGSFQAFMQLLYYAAGFIVSASALSVAEVHRRLRPAGTVAVAATISSQTTLRRLLTEATVTATSALSGQQGLFNRFSGAVAAISVLSFPNLISRFFVNGTIAAISALEAALTFISGAATLIIGGMVAAVSALSFSNLISRLRLMGSVAVTSALSLAKLISRISLSGLIAVTSSLSAALNFIGTAATYVVGGVIAAESYIVARVSLIVQLLIDQWKATFNTLALGGALAVSSSLSAMTILRRILTAATIAAISAMSAHAALRRLLTAAIVAANSAMSFGILQRFYRMAGMVVSASAMSMAAIQSMLRMAGSLATTSAMTAQTILRRLLTAATITATSALSFSAVIMRQMFAGLVSSASSLLGKLQYVGGIITVLLAGMIESASSISFTSLIKRLIMAGSLAAVSAFSGAARLVWLFTGAVASASTMVFGTLRRTFLISGTIRAVSSFVALAIQGATAVIVTVHRLIRPIALLMGRIRGDKRNITK